MKSNNDHVSLLRVHFCTARISVPCLNAGCVGRAGPGHPGERGEEHQVHAAGPGLQAQAGHHYFYVLLCLILCT
jgi:hypothetical protein